MPSTSPASTPTHVVIVGGGYAGYNAALSLQRRRHQTGIRTTVVDPSDYLTYQPLLPEVAGGHIDPRSVAVPLRRALRHSTVLRGSLAGYDDEAKTVHIATPDGASVDLLYDQLVLTTGAMSRVFPTPGLEQQGIGFKSLEEAVYLRDHVLQCVSDAARTTDANERRRLLTFVFVGGGYTGVEALTELEDLSRGAMRSFESLDTERPRWVLIEMLDRVAPELGPELSRWTLRHLADRGIDVRLKTKVDSCEDGRVRLDSGDEFEAGTFVWTAGVQPNPALDSTPAPRGPKGHVMANPYLQVIREDGSVVAGVWAFGDNAQVPDLTAAKQPAYCVPNAQHALRQAWLAARNIAAAVTGEPLEEYRHQSLGTIAGYGVGKGAAVIKGVKLTGVPAWLCHRGYHALTMPTLDRRIRIVAGWLVEAITHRDITSLSAVRHPKRPFADAFRLEVHDKK